MRSSRIISIAVLASLGVAVPAFAQSVSAAKSRVMQAQDFADKGDKDDAQAKLTEAEGFLNGLTDAEKAPVEKDIADLRAKLGGGGGSGAGAGNTGAGNAAAGGGGAAGAGNGGGAVDPEVSGRIERNVGRYLSFAEGDADSSPQNAGTELDQAVDALNTDDAKANLNADARAKLQARVDTLKAKLKGANTSEESKRFAGRVEQNLRAADENAGNDTRFTRTRLDDATSLLESDEAKQKLDSATMQRLRNSLADGEAKLAAVNKKDALDRAGRLLTALEEKIATDPFAGTASDQVYKVTEELDALRSRAADQLTRIPDGDADRKSAEDRLTAAQTKINGYNDAWAAANVEASIVNRWTFISDRIQGWDSESYSPSAVAFEKPKVPKTEQAIAETQAFLHDKQTINARQNQANLPKAAGAIAAADKTLADAETKLDSTFNQWMDAAEQQPRPQGANRFDIGAAADMARWADDRLAGSKYKDADVARAKKLDQRWQDELAAIKQQHDEARQKMTADANSAWPGIASSINSTDGFRPTDTASSVGKTFLFKNVRNRSGWDFDNRFDLVIWVDGQPVAGTYDPKIKKAFADVARQIGDSVDDHIDWDVIAVIDGKGEANQRYSTEVKDDHMDVLGKIEGTRPVNCVVMHVIAIHAGPIAMNAN